MKREIKFRGKRLTDGAWIYGSLVNIEEDRYAVLPVINTMRGETIAMYEVDPDTVGQYTGLKDKSSKEIYEDDIVQYPNDNRTETSVVRYDCSEFSPLFILAVTSSLLDGKVECNIIGNIHDNPELIKEE